MESVMAALPNLVPAGIFLSASTFSNACLSYCMSKPTQNEIFFTPNGLFSQPSGFALSKKLPANIFCPVNLPNE
jgi:hypothetical protein